MLLISNSNYWAISGMAQLGDAALIGSFVHGRKQWPFVGVQVSYVCSFRSLNGPTNMETGSRGGYFWLTTREYELHDVIASCPQIVLGKYIAVTSFDSGPLVPNEDEMACGWQSRGGIAYSPKVESVERLPHDVYDEWYVFKSPQDLGNLYRGNIFEASIQAGQVATFVNFGPGFSLKNSDGKDLTDLFWSQLELIQLDSFISDGDLLNLVTPDGQLFESVRAALK